jgi:hypothetical protein
VWADAILAELGNVAVKWNNYPDRCLVGGIQFDAASEPQEEKTK